LHSYLIEWNACKSSLVLLNLLWDIAHFFTGDNPSVQFERGKQQELTNVAVDVKTQ